MVLEQLDICVQKHKPEPTLCTYKNLTQKGSYPNAKPKTMKLLGENIEENLCDLGLGKDFLGHIHTQKVNHKRKRGINRTSLKLKLKSSFQKYC